MLSSSHFLFSNFFFYFSFIFPSLSLYHLTFFLTFLDFFLFFLINPFLQELCMSCTLCFFPSPPPLLLAAVSLIPWWVFIWLLQVSMHLKVKLGCLSEPILCGQSLTQKHSGYFYSETRSNGIKKKKENKKMKTEKNGGNMLSQKPQTAKQ